MKAQPMKTEEQNLYVNYLDPVKKRFPIFGNRVVETVLAFNAGVPKKLGYTAEEICCMGKQLARVVNQSIYGYYSDRQYDDKGNVIGEKNANTSANQDRYEYQDGQIVVVTSKGAGGNETAWEYSATPEADEMAESKDSDPMTMMLEAKYTGDMIKAMRTRKKMSRADMAADMKMTKARLAEIEDGDEPDEDEMSDIAGALGVTPKRFSRMVALLKQVDDEKSAGEEQADAAPEVYEVVSEVYDIVEIAEQVVEDAKNEQLIFTQESVATRVFRGAEEQCYKIYGRFISEEIKKNSDGTITFKVPLFKEGELTSNGNRYLCGAKLEKHFSRINQKNSKIETTGEAKKLPIDIDVANYLDGRSLDMLATHRGRLGEGNPLLERAGRIIGGEVGLLEGDKTFFLIGKTIKGFAGESIAAQILEGMIRGVSLFGIPTKFEENGDGGHDVFDMEIVGADFTDDGGNLIQFKDKANAGFTVMN